MKTKSYYITSVVMKMATLHFSIIICFLLLGKSSYVSGNSKMEIPGSSDAFRVKRATAACTDTYSYSTCYSYKYQGLCSHYQYRYYCRRTCGLCKVKHVRPVTTTCRDTYAANSANSCATWVVKGYCTSTKYKVWMKNRCANSCGYCVCKDLNQYCLSWARKGECTRNPTYMLRNCQLSCGVCRPKTKKPVTKPKPKPATKKPTAKSTNKPTNGPTTTASRRTCGISQTTGARIVGGKHALPGEWPWHVAITNCVDCADTLPFCGGTLINDEWVVTAAHCISGLQASKLFIVLGETNFLQKSRHEVIRKVKAIYSHDLYAIGARYDYDIALIRLNAPVSFTPYIQPACLPHRHRKLPAGMNCTVTGFGRTSERGPKSPRLRDARVPLIDFAGCKKVIGESGHLRITSTMLCAGYINGGIDSCQADSGGPLVCNSTDGSYELTGVVSWGKGCARVNQYGVYANMHVLRGWVDKVIAENP